MMETNIYLSVFENELMESKPTHKYKLGDLVELENGARVYITRLTYDCDHVPMYGFSIEPKICWTGGKILESICGYSENFIKNKVSHTNAILCFKAGGGYHECYLKDILPLLKQGENQRVTVDIHCSLEKLLELNIED